MNLTDKQIERFAEYFPEIQYYSLAKDENTQTLEQFQLIKQFNQLKNNTKTKKRTKQYQGNFSLGLIVGIIATFLILLLGSSIVPNMSSINQASSLYHLKQDLTKYWYPVSEKTPKTERAKNLLKFSEIRHGEAKQLTITNLEEKSKLIKETLLKAGDNYRAALELNPDLRNKKVTQTLASIRSWAEGEENNEILEITDELGKMYSSLTKAE
jgi:hypothetical protein